VAAVAAGTASARPAGRRVGGSPGRRVDVLGPRPPICARDCRRSSRSRSAIRKYSNQAKDKLSNPASRADLRGAIKLVSPTTFVYLAADRGSTNLAIVRNAVTKHAAAFI
jgi:hypothetical protein